MSQPLAGNEQPRLKGVIIDYIIHNMLSFLGASTNDTKKNQEKAKGK